MGDAKWVIIILLLVPCFILFPALVLDREELVRVLCIGSKCGTSVVVV